MKKRPFIVQVNNEKFRFHDASEAWDFMIKNNGHLTMAFRYQKIKA